MNAQEGASLLIRPIKCGATTIKCWFLWICHIMVVGKRYKQKKTERRKKAGIPPMTAHMGKQQPINLQNAGKRDVRTQFAALCYRMVDGKPEVLLITSRRSGRWILPKGWPMDGKTPAESAATEAWEEAGVQGKVHPRCLGLFSYHKEMTAQEPSLPCVAMVYALRVKSLSTKYPEAGQRKRKWLRPKRAAERVAEPELAHILRKFDPSVL